MTENEISYRTRGCIFTVYNKLGSRLLESAYEAALVFELQNAGFEVAHQLGLPMIYCAVKLDIGYRVDIMINKTIIVEVKSVETLLNVHHKQVITLPETFRVKLGLLVNFNTDDIARNIARKVNNHNS